MAETATQTPAWLSLATREELERQCWRAEQAKKLLRAAGYGCIGMDILDTVRELLNA